MEGASLEAAGAFSTRLYLPNQDIELVAVKQEASKVVLMKEFSRAILHHPDKYSNLKVVAQNKAPVLTFRCPKEGLSVQVHFNRADLVRESDEMVKNLKHTHELKYLTYFMIIFLRQRDLDN